MIAASLLLALAGDPLAPGLAQDAPAPAHLEDSEPRTPGWTFTIEPYLWLAGLEGRGGTGAVPPSDIGENLSLFGQLDGGFLLAFDATPPSGRLRWFGNGLILSLADDEGPLQTATDAWMVELGGGLALDAERAWEVTAGLRYVDLDYRMDLASVASASAHVDWLDPWIGARGTIGLAESWDLALRADVGGFGVGSQLTWQGMAGVRKSFGTSLRLDLGYRALRIDFDDDGLEYDVLVHGPVIGLAYQP